MSTVPAPADPFQLMAERHRKERAREFGRKRQRPVEEEKKRTNVQRLKQDILNTAPGIFEAVKLELVDGRSGAGTGTTGSELQEGSVRTIEILVKSKPWDNVSSAGKVGLLQKTFDLLRTRYPAVTKFVQMTFDDGRKDLVLKFAPD